MKKIIWRLYMSTITFYEWLEKEKRSRRVARNRGQVVQLLALSNCCELVKMIKSFHDLMKVIIDYPFLKDYRIELWNLWKQYCQACSHPVL
jgi:hypothetical protein